MNAIKKVREKVATSNSMLDAMMIQHGDGDLIIAIAQSVQGTEWLS
jgi:hypothetical protein